ncbi:hypothetical protein OG576_35925 [Streptomyces sp. NBC_01500]|nr:hypothetical protein [Streptomyces sp. NBC_01500]
MNGEVGQGIGMDKLNPNALAECGDSELDSRDGVQEVDATMIYNYVAFDRKELPVESALPFSNWLHDSWSDFNEEGARTNGAVISRALAFWRGE